MTMTMTMKRMMIDMAGARSPQSYGLLIRVVRASAGAAALLGALATHGCASDQELSGPLPSPDGEQFVKEVYPLLLRDCAHTTCHGVTERFFQLYGPGRIRMPAAAIDYTDPMNLEEVLWSYERARSMLATSEHIEDSLLLNKPLEAQAGGQGHKGIDELGRNVYASKRDPGWRLLSAWAHSHGSPPTAAQVRAVSDAAASEAAP
jgi:hypothetical protein